ncbi:hypothetical protein DB347_14570 [Opitutaceae bacterium EW11]|nr:hypothetical protein DB347_14570 [Opitutaceae bacterium EW11]
MANRAKTSPVESTRSVSSGPGRTLRWLLLASFLGNAALAIMAFRFASGPREVAHAAPPPAAATAPSAATTGDAPLSTTLRPYAALGTYVSENNRIPALHWTEEQFAAFQQGMRSSFEGRGYPVDDDAIKLRHEINAKVQSMMKGTPKADPIEEYFQTIREKEGVQRTSSGLHYRITEKGFGTAHPTAQSTVVVSYSARLPGGQALPDLSRARVRSAVADLLPGLAEGVQMMTTSGKALLYLPPSLSFGNGDWPAGVPKGAPIIFFVELHEIVPTENDSSN